MSDYDDVVESVLVEEEQAVEEAESEGGHTGQPHQAKYLSMYITVISLVVAVAALVTAFSADQWMEDALTDVADSMSYLTLRVEKRCHEIRRDLATLNGRALDDELSAEMEKTAHDLALVERNRSHVGQDAMLTDRAHYVLAIAITLLQIATALAAVMGVANLRHLVYASVTFACCGIILTIIGVTKFLT